MAEEDQKKYPVLYPYQKSKQIERYLSQFMRAMSGFQTQDGVARPDIPIMPRRVPVVYGNMSRLVAHFLKRGDSYVNEKLPLFAFNLQGIELDPERKRNSRHVDWVNTYEIDRNPSLDARRLIGPPFRLNIEVSLYASSVTELLDILEQVLLIFNPRLVIQADYSAFNPDYITEIELAGIQPEIQYPMGQERQIVSLVLNFMIPIRLAYPMIVEDTNLIEKIRANIWDLSTTAFLGDVIIPEDPEQDIRFLVDSEGVGFVDDSGNAVGFEEND